MGAGDQYQFPVPNKHIPEDFRQGQVWQTPVQDFLCLRIAPGDCVPDNKQIRVGCVGNIK